MKTSLRQEDSLLPALGHVAVKRVIWSKTLLYDRG